jgi:RNA-directed DNA polymerase
MKRIGYIYEKICDIENIKTAIRKSSIGKRNRQYVLEITTNIDYYAEKIQKLLQEKSYIPSPYKIKVIKDGSTQKERKIFKPEYYPDQIIHWALMLQLHELFLKGMYTYTCGGVLGRGTSYGQKTLRKWIDKDKVNTKYCLKMDISKYYSSINKEILKQKIANIIKDKNCLWLIDIIIDSCEKGVPIGNYTSQWFSNYFLQELDYFIKCDLGAKYYIRYVDDLIIMGSNKKALHKMRKKIEIYLNSIDLKLNKNWQVFPLSKRAIDFLGIRFYKNKTTLRRRNSLRIRRRMKKISLKENMNYQDACAIVSYWGWIKRTDSYSFYSSFKNKKINVKRAKRTISKYARKEIQINEL